MKIAVIDTETTGLNPAVEKVCELGVVVVENCRVVGHAFCLVDPGKSIPPEVSAIHHITDADVKGAWKLEQALKTFVPEDTDFYAAHNASFDSSFLPMLPKPWIDTWRCACHIFPESPSFSNQTLRYHLKLDLGELPESGRSCLPHSAGFDAWVTAHLLLQMLEKHPPEKLLELSALPVLLKKMPFGKHFGLPFKEVPKDYVRWLLRQSDLSEDLRHTLEHYAAT